MLNIKKIEDSLFRKWLFTIPVNIRQEILQYKFVKDQKLKLFGKLMIEHYCSTMNYSFSWSNWKLSTLGKPFLKNGPDFNISHSEDYVVVAFGKGSIGVDIEKMSSRNVADISHFFHPIEIDFINNSFNRTVAFYKVWTRKEAYLKAKGIGMIENLNKTNCLPSLIIDKVKWKLETINVIEGYQISVCIPNKIDIQIKVIDVTENFMRYCL